MAKKKKGNHWQGKKKSTEDVFVCTADNVESLFNAPVIPQIKEQPVTAPSKAIAAPAPSSPPLLLSVAQLCTMLNVSRSTIVRMQQSGSLPGQIKLGRSVRYHREEIENWLRGFKSAPIV